MEGKNSKCFTFLLYIKFLYIKFLLYKIFKKYIYFICISRVGRNNNKHEMLESSQGLESGRKHRDETYHTVQCFKTTIENCRKLEDKAVALTRKKEWKGLKKDSPEKCLLNKVSKVK